MPVPFRNVIFTYHSSRVFSETESNVVTFFFFFQKIETNGLQEHFQSSLQNQVNSVNNSK